MLVVVKHHGDRDDQRNGKEIVAQELRDDVPVQPLENLSSIPFLHIASLFIIVYTCC
jgi:hypothetical protein